MKLDTSQPNMPSAERLLSTLQAEKMKLTESHARLKPKLKSAKHELAVKSIANVPAGRIILGRCQLHSLSKSMHFDTIVPTIIYSMNQEYVNSCVSNIDVLKGFNWKCYFAISKLNTFESRQFQSTSAKFSD